LKTPISYYGGKQRIATRIVEILESISHTVYCEPFAGGLAVLFAKPVRSENKNDTFYREAINDINRNLTTFYKVARENPEELARWIDCTLYAKAEHQLARKIYRNPDQHSELEIAWATYVECNMSFAKAIGAGWGFGLLSQSPAATWDSRKQRLPRCFDRLRKVHVDCVDALEFIKRWDSPNTLFYCDPPYPATEQGHYKGYTIEDWQALCDLLDTIQGSYVLSGYPLEIQPQSAESVIKIEATMTAAGNTKKTRSCKKARDRLEVLWIRDQKGIKSLPLFSFCP